MTYGEGSAVKPFLDADGSRWEIGPISSSQYAEATTLAYAFSQKAEPELRGCAYYGFLVYALTRQERLARGLEAFVPFTEAIRTNRSQVRAILAVLRAVDPRWELSRSFIDADGRRWSLDSIPKRRLRRAFAVGSDMADVFHSRASDRIWHRRAYAYACSIVMHRVLSRQRVEPEEFLERISPPEILLPAWSAIRAAAGLRPSSRIREII